ncbi:WD40 repeat domain-containing serine/threonine protein kinase [Nocardiopsis salina]|uniref:WD40 repeat domain-containing serine/threonine protein kinase n=1 Tax=Nocardiopsis salina TaxID=245836 RepID=UPI00034B2B55|nr:serine/threonine-protein kinase [Nocardiopsis salina]
MDPLAPSDPAFIGPHRLLARIGAGGMGAVYLARTPDDGLAAVKVAHRDLARNTDFRARFAREVHAARTVRGPFTPAVVDAGPEDPAPWMATEYVPGPTLKQAVSADGPLPPDSLPVLLLGLARALRAVHAAGIMHRDLKPSNVLLSPRGPQVIDFGIARAVEGTVLTRTGQAFGTPAYAAPETVLGHEQGPHSDMFSLASVVVLAATGRPAFGRGSPSRVLRRVVREEPDLDGVPDGALRSTLERCLSKDARRRPGAEEVLADPELARAASAEHGWLPETVHRDIGAREQRAHHVMRSVPVAPPAPAARRSRAPLVAGAAAGALVLIAGTGLALVRPWEEAAGGDAAEEAPSEPPGHPDIPGHVRGLHFTPDGDVLKVLTSDNLTEWDWREGELLDTWDTPPDSYDLTGDGVAALGSDDGVEVHEDHRADTSVTYTSPEAEDVLGYDSVSLAEDETLVAFVERHEERRVAKVWDWSGPEGDEGLVLETEVDDHPEDIVSILLAPDGSHAAVIHDQRPAHTELLEVDSGERVAAFPEEALDGDAPDTGNAAFVPAFSADSSLMAVYRDDRSAVDLYDLEEAEVVDEFGLPAEGGVADLVFTPDGSRLMSSSTRNEPDEDAGGRMWDLDGGGELSDGDTLLHGRVAVHPGDGTIVASEWGERGNTLFFLDPDTLLDTHRIE